MDRPVLAYLDLLCSALIARDHPALSRLAADPAYATLPESVRCEIDECRMVDSVRRAAPIHTLHLYYQQVQLSRHTVAVTPLRPLPDPAPDSAARASQIELPLFAA
jgi:hypothetical protein